MIATLNGNARAAIALIVVLLSLVGCQTTPGSGEADPRRGRVGHPQTEGEAAEPVAAKPRRQVDAPESAGADLWAAIRGDFALDHEIDHPRVRAEIVALQRYPNHLLNMRERLELYLPHVFEQVRERGMPAELALLPILESGMNPHAEALSGPAGLWQFIPATADRLDLPRNWWYDGRRDPALSTRAALDYLDYLHTRFDDWRLAIVAYNAGEGTVTRALQGRSGPVSFWSLRLPQAGMVYIPKLLALAEVVANPEDYGITLPELQTSPTFATLPTGGQVEIARAAEALGVDEETLYLLNPALNRTATPPDGPHQLNVPPALADEARHWLGGLEQQDRVAWERIQVRRGDSLSVIATRHGTDVRTLRQINNLPNDLLRAGQYLFVPGPEARGRSPGEAAVAAAPKPPGTRAPTGRGSIDKAHVVRPGDTLWGIARDYRVGVASLAAANRLETGHVLKIGQRLVIPNASAKRG